MTDEAQYDKMTKRPYTLTSTVKRGRKKGKSYAHLRLTKEEILARYEKKYGPKVAQYLKEWTPHGWIRLEDIGSLMGCSRQNVGDIIKRMRRG